MHWQIISFLILLAPIVSRTQIDVSYINKLKYEHDLIRLPDWGPYTKDYIGVSHIPSKEEGIRFDLSVFPGYYRTKTNAPDVKFDSGFHPWEVAPNLDYFSFRHELEWKDQLYTDIAYAKIDDQARLIQIEAVNNTGYAQSIALHMMGSISFPAITPWSPDKDLSPTKVTLPENSYWTEATDYLLTSKFTDDSPYRNLAHLGKMHKERRRNGVVEGSCVEMDQYDELHYSAQLNKNLNNAVLILRYRLKESSKNTLNIQLGDINKKIQLEESTTFTPVYVSLGDLKTGKYTLSLSNSSETNLFVDGFTIVEQPQQDEVKFEQVEWNYVPELSAGPQENTLILKYENIDVYYGIKWEAEDYGIREWFFDKLSDGFKRRVNNNVNKEFREANSKKHYTNIYIRPITLQPNSKKLLNAYVYSGSKEEVLQRLQNDNIDEAEVIRKAKSSLVNLEEGTIPAGQPYIFSNRIFSANILGNLVFPIFANGQYIKHYPPGRAWNSLYTWDAGFIDLGLAQLNVKNAIEYLNTYLNDVDEQSAFIHHGSLVPVQHYMFKEIWEKSLSEEYLSYFYPKLKKYYDFYLGKSGSSTMADFNSGLIKTWDYFYNSGGWDDYPPQKYIHDKKIVKSVAPIVNTAHSIRIAKIMKQAAVRLGLDADVEVYEEDIEKLTDALQEHAWDEASGYFGYVLHDDNKEATSILKYKDTINYNMGMDGAYPIVADVCTPQQEEILLHKLKTEGRIWSKIGLSAVDQQAPYYSREGYWNGSVWMPHQWFFWKSMLDMGESEFAFKIAQTALDLWKKETDRTYNTYEHFIIESASGAGWHQFSGLSTPVIYWFTAYYRVGHLSTGYNVWLNRKEWNEDYSSLNAEMNLDYGAGEKFSLVACMNPENDYVVYWNGEKTNYETLHKGTLNITLKGSSGKKGVLKIVKK